MKLFSLLASFISLLSSQLAVGEAHDPFCPCNASSDNEEVCEGALLGTVDITPPAGLPSAFELTLTIGQQAYELAFTKSYVFGENTRFLLQGNDGTLTEIDRGADRSYLGHVVGKPGVSLHGQLTTHGLLATITLLNSDQYIISPNWDDASSTLHTILHRHASGRAVEQETDAPEISATANAAKKKSARRSSALAPDSPVRRSSSRQNTSGGATQPPSRVIQVLEYEVGVEIGSRAFSGAHNGDVTQAMANAATIPGNMDARYLRATGLKHVLGTVIIRQNAATDPLRDDILDNSTAGLRAFQEYWNDNPSEVGTSHDLAVYHVFSPPSGRAFVNSVGSAERYATTCGQGGTSWANGTLVHEFGHSWDVLHTFDPPTDVYNFSPSASQPSRFYEAKPRLAGGSTSAGGDHLFVSIMDGRGQHNIGRLASDEAAIVLAAKANKTSFGDVVSNPDNIPPFGVYDRVTASTGSPMIIDVIANDYDSNNHVLDVRLLDTVSHAGASISLSQGTGPGGRCEIVYTPAFGFQGVDFFHYTVVDSTGQTDFGAVYVDYTGPFLIDRDAAEYRYDFGTDSSPVQAGFTGITPDLSGDVSWSQPLPSSADRGANSSTTDASRDIILSSNSTTFRHTLRNGTWNVALVLGDPNNARDNMRVSAENGQVVRSNLSSASGSTVTVSFDVIVRDKQLDLTISDDDPVLRNWSASQLVITLVDSFIDLDSDGLNDNLEEDFFGNLTTTDGLPGQDFDSDSLDDRAEFGLGSNPTLTDSDGDGLLDGAEVNAHNSSPTLLDTDGDGFLDGSEVARNTLPDDATSQPELIGLVAYYPFDDASGTTARNIGSLGTTLNAEQNQGTICWAQNGQIAGASALDLDGASSLLADSPLSTSTTEFTISLWVDPAALRPFTGVYIGRNSPGNWGINLEGEKADVRFANSGGSSTGIDTASGSIPVTGGWHHIVQTWTTTGNSSASAVYLNGQLVQTTSVARNDFTLPTLGFFIGDDPAVNGRELHGLIDELAIFSRALDATEVTSIYNTGLAGNPLVDAALEAETNGDSDNDGLPDQAELDAFGDLTTTAGGPSEDFDNDGLTDRFEILTSGTNPAQADTDGDGLDDKAERDIHSTDPLLADTDGDGFSDRTELLHRSDANNASSLPTLPDLLAYYPFNETTGTVAKNFGSLGSALDATQNQGTIGWSTSGQLAGASSLDLDGSSSLVAPSPFTTATRAFTISAWIDPDSIGQFIGLYVGRNSPGNWGLNLNSERIDARFANTSGSSFGLDSANGSVTAVAGWVHVAQTWTSDGSSTFGQLFINGTLSATTTGARPDFTQPTLGFFIGDDPAVSGREYDGKMDELAVFSRVLEAQEISTIHTQGVAGKTVFDALPPAPSPQMVDLTFDTTGRSIAFDLPTEIGVTYRVLGSPNLIDWILLQTITGDGSLVSITTPQRTDLRHFFRIEATR